LTTAPETRTILEVREVRKAFGGVRALDGVSVEVHADEVLGLIGPNGSGKTTLFNCISGFEHLDGGRIVWQGHDVSRWSPDRRSRAGLVRTFQQVMVFNEESVFVNLCQAILCANWTRPVRSQRREAQGSQDVAAAALRTAHLAGLDRWARSETPVSELAHGTQRLLGVGMALATGPALLMLDEPAAGLHDDEIDVLASVLTALPEAGVSVLVVDHNMNFVLNLCRRVVVLDSGEKLVEGTPEEVGKDPRVINVYLGSSLATGAKASSAPDANDPNESPAAAALTAMYEMVETGDLPNADTHGTASVGDSAPTGRSDSEAGSQSTPPPRARLVVRDLYAGYGTAVALRHANLVVNDGEVVAVLGPNGAGKTTLLRSISGAARILSGSIEYEGGRLNGRSPDDIMNVGIAHVLEGRRVFASLTVEENLKVAWGKASRDTRWADLQRIFDTFPDLARLRELRGDQLSGGQQQQLAIARALMSRPKLLLLDEPSLGLSPVMIEVILDVIRRVIADMGVSVLLVEQAVWLAREVADRAYVLDSGSVVYEGRLAELDHDQMASLYFGSAERRTA
jgi:ABC-type branched-subunit amino acid transport system ATPase component